MESQKSLTEDWFLWLLLLAAVGLTGSYYFFTFSPNPQGKDSPEWVFDGVESDAIRAVKKYRGDSLVLSVKRDSNGWSLSHPDAVNLAPSAAQNWIKALLSPEIQRRFKASPGADYGISTNSTRIKLRIGQKEHELYFGGKDPTGQGFYLRYGKAEESPVFLVANRSRENIIPDLYTLRDKDLFDRPFSELTSATFATDTDMITYEKKSGGWRIQSPRNSTLSETQSRSVENNLRTLVESTASSFHDTRPPSPLDPARATIRLRFGKTKTIVNIGGKKDDERLISIEGKPAMGVTVDPLRTFRDLPVKPEGWPVVEPSTGAEKPQSPETRQQMKELRQKMQKSPTGE